LLLQEQHAYLLNTIGDVKPKKITGLLRNAPADGTGTVNSPGDLGTSRWQLKMEPYIKAVP